MMQCVHVSVSFVWNASVSEPWYCMYAGPEQCGTQDTWKLHVHLLWCQSWWQWDYIPMQPGWIGLQYHQHSCHWYESSWIQSIFVCL